MARDKQILLLELGIVALISYWWFFVATNVNPTLGNIYTNITIGAIAIFFADYFFGSKSIKLINPNVSWTQAFVFAGFSYAILIGSSQLTNYVAQAIPLTETLKLLGSSAPVFSASRIINYITFAFMIAYIETYALFVVGYDLLASMFNVKIDSKSLYSLKTWIIILGISLMFLGDVFSKTSY